MTDVAQTETTETLSDSLLDTVEAKQPDASGLDFSKGKPEGFPDDLWDGEKNAPKVQDLYAKYQEAENRAKGLREKLSKGAQNAPKDPKEYELKLSDETAKVIKSDDPMIQQARSVAHKYGLSKEAFNGFMSEMSDFVAKATLDNQANDDPAAQKAAIEAHRREEMAKLGENGAQVVKAVASWGNELASQGRFTESDLKAFKDMAYSADAVRVLNIMRSMIGGGRDVPMEPASDGFSRAELEQQLVKAYNANDGVTYEKLSAQLAAMRK